MDNILHVLIIEDSEEDTKLLIRELRHLDYEIQFERVATEKDLRISLNKKWNLVLSDYSMPAFNGMDALKMVREVDRNLPFIFVSGTLNEDLAVEATRLGATDYIFKSNLQRLLPSLKYALNAAKTKNARDIDERAFFQTQGIESMGQLMGGISHDFNNLLMVIQGNLEILRMELTGNEEYTQQIDLTLEATHACGELVKKLMAFSKLQPSQIADELPAQAAVGLYGDETILLVEDEENLRQLAARYLDSLGYRVLQAENGADALQILQQEPSIQLLLTDIAMPGELTGPQLVDKAIMHQPTLKILYMSGYPKKLLLEESQMNIGNYPVIIKPFSRFDLAKLLRNILNKK